MFRGISLFGLRRQQLKTRRLRPTVKPWLEELTERILPSASTVDSQAMEQWNQLISTLQNDLNSIYNTIGQEITEEFASVEQQWDLLVGLPVPNAPNQPPSSVAPQPGTGSGSGSGATMTTSNGPNQQLNNGTPKSGSGSGSGATASHKNPSRPSPMIGSGSLPLINLAGSGDYSGSEAAASGSCGPSNVDIQVTITTPVNQTATVNYATSDITATAGTDYTAKSGTLTFVPGGQTYQTISIPILDDGGDEDGGSQSFGVSLSDPSGATIGPNQSTVVFIQEGPPQAATDTLQWNPCMGNTDASTASNWYDVTQGFQLQNGDLGPNPSSPIILDGTSNSTTSKNASLIWDHSFTLPSVTIQNGYDALQTVEGDIVLTGDQNDVSLYMDDSGYSGPAMGKAARPMAAAGFSELNANLINGADYMIKQNATITNMDLKGTSPSKLEIAGGTTTMAFLANFTEQTQVSITVDKGATLLDFGQCPLTFTANGAVLTVNGEMDVDGNAFGITLLAQPQNGNDYIDVAGGTLKYLGNAGITDTFALPVIVEGGGTFMVDEGYLIVQGSVAKTLNNSVYLTGFTSYMTLLNSATLECDNHYLQDNGILQTADTTECTLQDGPAGKGATQIQGGIVQIASGGGYGTLDINSSNLLLDATLNLHIQGNQSGTNSVLQNKTNGGIITLGGKSSLFVTDDNANQVAKGGWIIIDKATNIVGNFSSTIMNPVDNNFTYLVNMPNAGQYKVSYMGG